MTSDRPADYDAGTMSFFEKDGKIKEDVDVKDSRTIRLTPTTKNQILTLVHELAAGYVAVKPGDTSKAQQLTKQGFNVTFDNQIK